MGVECALVEIWTVSGETRPSLVGRTTFSRIVVSPWQDGEGVSEDEEGSESEQEEQGNRGLLKSSRRILFDSVFVSLV